MLKVSTFLAETEQGYSAVPLFGPGDSEFEKNASPYLLPPVLQYIENLRPRDDSQYVLVNALAAGEYFGCFPAGTLVDTEHGEQNIEEVEPGTLVRTHLNRLRPVLARTPKQAEELCDLYVQGLPSNLPALSATPNHELWVIHRQDFAQTKRRVVWKGDTNISVEQRREQALREMEFSWLPISSLQPGDYIAEPFPLEEDPAALGDEKWNCPEVAFLMGLYAAEGCIARHYDREDDRAASVIYVVSGEETDVIARARKHAESLGHGLQDYESETGTSYRLQLCFAEFARLCEHHVGTPAVHKKLSASLLRMPRGWQKVFLAAYAAGDGCVRKSGKEESTQRMVSASAALLRGVRLMLARQGLVASISGRHNKKASWYNGNPIYELSVSGGQLKGRGTPKSYLHPDGYILSAVKRVEQYDWEGEVFDLTVEEDSSFVASGICVHNSNINGDHFPEASLIHSPQGWTGNPLVDKALAKDWPYGFPTFYNAHPFAHHRNKDPKRAYGEVELALWNDHMKRVELVVRVDLDKCKLHGGIPVWDKLKAGQFPDVSMGSKVPYDTSSITLDWKLYREAQATFDPKRHKHPGIAVLEFHKKLKAKNGKGIPGVSVTRDDYDEYCKKQMNRILPDGRKVFVYNDYPRFFDISFVFIGADRTAKVMVFISQPSVKVASVMGYVDVVDPGIWVPSSSSGMDKAASAIDQRFIDALVKGAEQKRAEIEKQVTPSQMAGKAIPVLNKNEPDLPKELINALASRPEDEALSTAGGLGIVIRPREFQRITLIRMGASPLADELDSAGITFPKVDEVDETKKLDPEKFSPALGKMLEPMMDSRSLLGPIIERRVVMISMPSKSEEKTASSHSSELLRKIGAAYNGYRAQLMDFIAHTRVCMNQIPSADGELGKLASADAEDTFTPLSYCYLRDAFLDELGVPMNQETVVQPN